MQAFSNLWRPVAILPHKEQVRIKGQHVRDAVSRLAGLNARLEDTVLQGKSGFIAIKWSFPLGLALMTA